MVAATSNDAGLYGPGSVTWQVIGDPVLVLGGVRSLFLQALHPIAMAAVAGHSDFRGDPWGRLARTADYIGVTTFGTTHEARRAAAKVRGMHRRVKGTEPRSGRAYQADDKDLLLWVHCCEVESFFTTVQRCGAELDRRSADRFYAEQVAGAALVGIPPERVPSNQAQMQAYFDDQRPLLHAGQAARQGARFVLAPPMRRPIAVVGRPAWAGFAMLAFAMLPRWARRMYGLPGLPTTDVAASVQGRMLRTALLALPASVRDGPHRRAAWERLAGA